VRYALAVLLALAVALPGPEPEAAERKPAAGRSQSSLVGLPVYSADGQKVGRILATGVDDGNRPVLVAEFERPLGIGTDAVAIPYDMFERKPGRIELTITAQEIAKRLSGAGRDR
jgi:hypothetical protein